MAEIPGIIGDKQKIYHREIILKKEGKTWIEYYAVLIGNSMIFNRKDDKTGRIIPHNITMIEINNKTQCGFGDNKTCYRFPFWLQNGKSKYQFKCETKLHRNKWMNAIRLCATGKPPEILQKIIPTKNTVQPARTKSSTNPTVVNNSKPQNGSTTVKSTPTSGAKTKQTGVNTKLLPKTPGNISTTSETKPTIVEKIISSNTYKIFNRSKSLDNPREKNAVNKNSATNESNKLNKNKREDNNVKSNIPRPRSNTSPKLNHSLQDSVLENPFVKDSMSDVRPSILNVVTRHQHISCYNNKNHDSEQTSRLSDEDLTPTNDLFRCISCHESFCKERSERAGTTPGRHGDNINNIKHNSDDQLQNFEYELNEKGEKFQKVQLQPDFVRINDEPGEVKYFGKTPVEHDELDSYPVKVKYRTDGHIETFDFPTPSRQLLCVRGNANETVSVDRFGKMRKISSNSLSSISLPPSRIGSPSGKDSPPEKYPLKNRRMLIEVMERAQSWASLQNRTLNHKAPDPQRRENSAPSLRFSRHNLDATNNN